MNYASFVGRHPIPVRHAMTMGEVARMHAKFWSGGKDSSAVAANERQKQIMSVNHFVEAPAAIFL